MTLPEDLRLSQHLALIQSRFERGQYRQALEQVRQAQSRYPQSGKLRLWQALAQEALGETQEAILLVQTLLRNPDPEVAQQARYVLGIWQAPRLRRSAEWLSEIPDLSRLEETDPPEYRLAYGRSQRKGPSPRSGAPSGDPLSRREVDPPLDTQPLIWVLIGILSTLLAVMAWLP
ncbi:tetratricopeptide repeat protein [Synechococcus sp. R55.3]|jgi:tetratricopeptide (TPR) repeat protein|uniref:tetratricopeptide repeat protein n=1 Tax=Synechococcus sp. R55.3 TaxID=2969647 RepID=UPI0039C46FC5